MATIKDVARRAGVSPSTVSYALSGKRTISQAARERVAAAIADLDFTPSALGRGLRNGHSGMIGIVFPLLEPAPDWLMLEFVATAAAVATRAGYTLSFYTRPGGGPEVLDLFRRNVVDGLILMQTTRCDARVEALRRGDYPFALIGRCDDMRGLRLVDFDYEGAAYAALEHLARLGHRRIGYIDLDRDGASGEYGFATYLQRGYERACRDLDVRIVRRVAGGSVADGYQATEHLLRSEPRITAIVPLFGSTPLGALRALRANGRRVPDDCSLVCIETAYAAEWSTPRLTSVDVPLGRIGEIGAELVLRRIAGETGAEQIILPAQLVMRESTAPPRETVLTTKTQRTRRQTEII